MTNPASFRDLSKPMGAQTPDRLKQFKKRYHDWDDPQGKENSWFFLFYYLVCSVGTIMNENKILKGIWILVRKSKLLNDADSKKNFEAHIEQINFNRLLQLKKKHFK